MASLKFFFFPFSQRNILNLVLFRRGEGYRCCYTGFDHCTFHFGPFRLFLLLLRERISSSSSLNLKFFVVGVVSDFSVLSRKFSLNFFLCSLDSSLSSLFLSLSLQIQPNPSWIWLRYFQGYRLCGKSTRTTTTRRTQPSTSHY